MASSRWLVRAMAAAVLALAAQVPRPRLVLVQAPLLERGRAPALRLPVVKAVPPRREQAEARLRRPCSPLAKKDRPPKKARKARPLRSASPKSTG